MEEEEAAPDMEGNKNNEDETSSIFTSDKMSQIFLFKLCLLLSLGSNSLRVCPREAGYLRQGGQLGAGDAHAGGGQAQAQARHGSSYCFCLFYLFHITARLIQVIYTVGIK